MNRIELKNKARELINGNKWYILKPLVFFGLAFAVVTFLAYCLDMAFGLTTKEVITIGDTIFTYNNGGIISDIVGLLVSLVSMAFGVSYAYYILSFVRGKKMELSDIVDWIKENWVIAVLVTLLAGLIILGFSILLIIPGIIAAIGLQFYQEVCVDNTDMKPMDIVRKTWNMTNGHKLDLFIIALSFIGWIILAPFTLGILYIWLAPYMTVTLTLAYEELKK